MKRFEYFDHTADIGVRAHGKTLKTLFTNSALALFDVLSDTKKIKGALKKEVSIKAPNLEELLINFLSELLYFYTSREFLIKKIKIKKLADCEIVAEIVGDDFDKRRHVLKAEVKGVTYHDFKITKAGDMYSAEIIFDV